MYLSAAFISVWELGTGQSSYMIRFKLFDLVLWFVKGQYRIIELIYAG